MCCITKTNLYICRDIMEVDIMPQNKAQDESTANARKRRRSELEEAIITVIETSSSCSSTSTEKRARLDDTADAKPDDDSKEVEEILQVIEIPKSEGEETPEDSAPNTDSEQSSSTEKEKIQRVTPIRIALVAKDKRHTRRSSSCKEPTAKIITSSKEDKPTPPRPKSSKTEKNEKLSSSRTEKSERPHRTEKPEKIFTRSDKVEKPNSQTEKSETTLTERPPREDRSRSEKRRNSRGNRSLNSSATRSSDKPSERRSDKSTESSKDKIKESTTSKDKGEPDKSRLEKQLSPVTDTLSPRSVKDRLQFDDDTTLAVIAREAGKSVTTENHTGLPTITSVRSLSTTAHNASATITKTTTTVKPVDITLEANSESSIFIPTSADNAATIKNAVSKLKKLINEEEPAKNHSVGRVGVRAFARMTSPDKQKKDDIHVEIKSEPIELDDADRHMEKMDLMNAFKLRPVNPPNPPTNLREVRINFNKVLLTPINPARKAPTKPPEVRPRAKKTFPQPKKPDDGRSELNSKNSMVYIPIQPPATQAPARLPRPTHTAQITLRPPAPVCSAGETLLLFVSLHF